MATEHSGACILIQNPFEMLGPGAKLRAVKGFFFHLWAQPELRDFAPFHPRLVWQPSFSPLPNLMISEPIPAFLHFKKS
jgi:hypothetical protein